ncbi:MAG: hypothetical protein QGD90_07515 [Candidatus Hydrogenedentes bacterium]|nr:hypothetical protein [Candidatus Hydrogenedentota bacterium]
MRTLLLVALTIAMSGCLMELLTVTAIQGELAAENAQSAARALSYAKESLANTELQHAISAYAAEKGHYPPTLGALVPDYLYSVPKTLSGRPYAYDPSTGRLADPAVAPAQAPFTAADRGNLQKVKDAVYLYWESTGYYPRTLDDLDPLYIEAVPKLSSGGVFIYDPRTGSVYHPADFTAQQAPASGGAHTAHGGVPAAGMGPMGEVMTGISIQNELNSMNHSGTSNLRYVGQRNVNNIVGQHNQQQMKALRDLNLQ